MTTPWEIDATLATDAGTGWEPTLGLLALSLQVVGWGSLFLRLLGCHGPIERWGCRGLLVSVTGLGCLMLLASNIHEMWLLTSALTAGILTLAVIGLPLSTAPQAMLEPDDLAYVERFTAAHVPQTSEPIRRLRVESHHGRPLSSAAV